MQVQLARVAGFARGALREGGDGGSAELLPAGRPIERQLQPTKRAFCCWVRQHLNSTMQLPQNRDRRLFLICYLKLAAATGVSPRNLQVRPAEDGNTMGR